MDLRPGYKQTEAGVIPEDWGISTVGHEFDVRLGKMLDAEKNVGEPKPYIGNSNVQWDKIDTTNLPLMRMTRDELQRFRLRDGDLLACEGGEVGRAAIWCSPIEECYYQKALHRLRPLRGFDSRLMLGFLRLWSKRGDLANYVTQTSIAHLPREKFIEVPLPVPTPPEQSAIANALSDVDALLAAQDALMAKKRAIKQGAMQELLTGKRRLPGFAGEWDTKRLGEISTIQRGASPRPIDSPEWFDENSDVGWVRISDVTSSGMYLGQTTQRLSPAGVSHSRLVKSGGLIMSICATVGRPVITAIDVCIHDGFVVFDALQADKAFIYYVLDWIEPNWSMHGQTGSQMNLNTGLINSTEVKLPTIEEQVAIAAVLSDMDAQLAVLGEQRRKSAELRQGMAQELLTGRIRLI